MSSPVLLADRLAAALRSHFRESHLGRRAVVIDNGRFVMFNHDYPLMLILHGKGGVIRSITRPMSRDFFDDVEVTCQLKMDGAELGDAFIQTVNNLIQQMNFSFCLPPRDENLLEYINVAAITAEGELKHQLVSLAILHQSARGRWQSRVHEMPLECIFSPVDIQRIWLEAKNEHRVDFGEFLGSSFTN